MHLALIERIKRLLWREARQAGDVPPERQVEVAKDTLGPLIDRAATLARAAYGQTAVIRSKLIQHLDEAPKLQWWVSYAGKSQEVLAADTLAGLVKLLEGKPALTATQKRAKVTQEKQKMNAASEVQQERLLTAAQAAAYLGVASATMSHWAKDGLIAFTQVPGQSATGKQYRFTRQALDDFQAKHKIQHRKSPRRSKSHNGSEPATTRNTHPQMNTDVSKRISKLVAKIQASSVISGLEISVTARSVYKAALMRGLDVLEREIES